MNDQNLNLTAEEKLSEKDIQAYKNWCFERQEEDNFKSLVQWLEVKVQIVHEAQEETAEYGKRRTHRPDEQKRFNK